MANPKSGVPRYIMRQLDAQIARIQKSINKSTARITQLKKLRDDLEKGKLIQEPDE